MSPYVAFFLALVFVLFNASTAEERLPYKMIIYFKSSMPTTTPILKFYCTPEAFTLPPQQTIYIASDVAKVASCHAVWNETLKADFTAFNPKTDLLNTKLYWIVKPDGFFMSLNNIQFEKKASWGP
ncbi:leguminosin group486 secreted peptide [Medicago truncatula]|uniref:Leguminosin group486 secreted peptide n=1 Tax=Medicago truncatula TaxID=3880 RepID=A0A072TXL5_MEDTR|nr:leguminosin group486 secreted peptide [Medicago truncatula]KEH22246.1 leguminosin group486 secreted peptide [Medicago truncatula]